MDAAQSVGKVKVRASSSGLRCPPNCYRMPMNSALHLDEAAWAVLRAQSAAFLAMLSLSKRRSKMVLHPKTGSLKLCCSEVNRDALGDVATSEKRQLFTILLAKNQHRTVRIPSSKKVGRIGKYI